MSSICSLFRTDGEFTAEMEKERVKQLKIGFGRSLEQAGFIRKRDTWYAHGSECIRAADLQKSQYGPQYYLNLGIWLNALGENQWPKVYQCHVRARGEVIAPEPGVLRPILNLEDTSISPDERRDRIADFVRSVVVPFLAKAKDLQGVRAILADRSARRMGVHRQVNRMFESL